MLSKEKTEQISQLIDLLSEELDIPNKKYIEAEKRYRAIGDWLGRSESDIKHLNPDIYVQGSFRLGTVITPITSEGEFDIDCVCVLELGKNQCTQKHLKDAVGKEIKLFAQVHSMQNPPKEGKRCWTLQYADGSKFHIDILPAIPYSESFRSMLFEKGYYDVNTSDAIAITDNTLTNYYSISNDWSVSNPKGYANWFKDKMSIVTKSIFNESKEIFDEFGSIENVPIYRIKTPLQKVVQILKKQRDLMFQDSEDKPISIIISTLSAHSYSNETNLLDALINIVKKMRGFISFQGGEYFIANPVNPLENFADKWKSNPSRKDAFFVWLSSLEKLFDEITGDYDGLDQFSESLNKLADKNTVKNVLERFGNTMYDKRVSGNLKVENRTGIINTNSGTKIKEHTFFGK